MSKESLIEDIMTDCKVAERSMKREKWELQAHQGWEEWLRDFGWARGMTGEDVREVERKVLGQDEKGSVEEGKL